MRRTGYASDNGVFYTLSDHLRSTSILVNQNGTVNSRNYFYPYGGNRNGAFSSLTTKRFTEQYQESSLPGGEGLYYYNARWYDARLARFVSADTVVPNPGNPQALNRCTMGWRRHSWHASCTGRQLAPKLKHTRHSHRW
ncbi:MAG: hypothetical protein FJ011_22680 [Chloroflexi bacterium]|nr:hypothetical protein [Chloroflexota bacterium]